MRRWIHIEIGRNVQRHGIKQRHEHFIQTAHGQRGRGIYENRLDRSHFNDGLLADISVDGSDNAHAFGRVAVNFQ